MSPHPLVTAALSLLMTVGATWNAQAHSPREDPFAGDARLDQRVRISIEGMAVADILSLLSAKSGVGLSASRFVGDDKAIVFSPARPMRESLADLAALFNDRWERITADDGRARYILTRVPSAIRYEDSLQEKMTARLMAHLEEQARALDEPAEQWSQRPDADPIRKVLSNPDGRRATELYGLLTTSQKRSLFATGRIKVPLEAISPRGQSVLREMTSSSVRGLPQLQDLEAGGPTIEDYVDAELARLETRGAQFKLSVHPRNQETTAFLSLGRTAGVVLARLPETSQWLLPRNGRPYPKQPQVGLTEENRQGALPDPDLYREASREAALPDRLRMLAERTERPLFADYYRTRTHALRVYPSEPAEPDRPVQALNDLAGVDGCLWWAEGRTLFFRKRDWFRQRLYEPPDRWLLAVVSRLEARHGQPAYEDLQRFHELTSRQIQGLMSSQRKDGSIQFRTEYDLCFQPGLRDLLDMLRPKPSPFAKTDPIASGRRSRADMERATLTVQMMTPEQRAVAPRFLEAQDEMMPVGPVESFAVYIVSHPESFDTGSKFVAVYINCQISAAQGHSDRFGDGNTTFELFLPLALPDDRRGRTIVEFDLPRGRSN